MERRTGEQVMRTTVIIAKSGEGYTISVSGRFRGGGNSDHLTPYDAATSAAKYMLHHAAPNPEGGVMMAPPEVLELVPVHLRAIPARDEQTDIERR